MSVGLTFAAYLEVGGSESTTDYVVGINDASNLNVGGSENTTDYVGGVAYSTYLGTLGRLKIPPTTSVDCSYPTSYGFGGIGFCRTLAMNSVMPASLPS